MFNKLFNKKSNHVPVSVDEHVLNNLRDINIEKEKNIEKQNNKENNYVPLFNKKGRSSKNVSNIVRIRFSKKRPQYSFPILNFYLGLEIAKVLDITGDDRVRFFYDTNSPKTVLIKKACETDENSYKVYSHFSKNCLWLQVSWTLYKPSPSHYKLTEVATSFQDGGLLVKLTEGKWF